MKPGRVRGWVRTHYLTNVELKRLWKKHLTTDLHVSPLRLPSSFQVFLASCNMVNGLVLNDVTYRPLSLAPRINLSLHVSSYRRSWIFHAFLLAIKTMSYLTLRWRNLFTNWKVLGTLRTAHTEKGVELPTTRLLAVTRRAAHTPFPHCHDVASSWPGRSLEDLEL